MKSKQMENELCITAAVHPIILRDKREVKRHTLVSAGLFWVCEHYPDYPKANDVTAYSSYLLIYHHGLTLIQLVPMCVIKPGDCITLSRRTKHASVTIHILTVLFTWPKSAPKATEEEKQQLKFPCYSLRPIRHQQGQLHHWATVFKQCWDGRHRGEYL